MYGLDGGCRLGGYRTTGAGVAHPGDKRARGCAVAQGALFVGWGPVARGRERQSLRIFGEAMAYYGRLREQGEIEAFEPVDARPRHRGTHIGRIAGRQQPD